MQRRLAILKSHILPEEAHQNNCLDQQSLELNNCAGPKSILDLSEGRPLESSEALRRYHIMLKRQDRSKIKLTKNLSDLCAFHSKDSKSLASRLLRSSEAGLFEKGYTNARESVWKVLNEDQYTIDNEWSMHQFRANLDTQFREFIKNKLITTEIMNENIYAFLGALEAGMNYDVSFAAKLVVSLQLYGTCIYKLGTQKHRYLLEDLNAARDIGCFMMTEIAHGSNVRAIETTATYDPATKEFIIHSPTESSYKYWIGNSAVYGTKACVFAQLIINNENKGVHAFYVPIRDQQTLELYEGISIQDIGHKQGWNAVDNGCIAFDRVRIPVDNLLNKYGNVTAEGKYESPIKDEGMRFAITLSALSMGRLLYISGPTFALKAGLTTAIRYAHQRRQFGSKVENTIWSYPTHPDKIMPMVAFTHAFFAGFSTLATEYANLDHNNMEDFHAVVSGIKAYSCEYTTPALRDLRVMCGGHGYSTNNRIGHLMNDMDVFNTAEGDETVLFIQLARYLIDKSKKKTTNPVLKEVLSASSKATSSDVLSLQFQVQALSFRVKKLIEECQADIAKCLKEKKDAQTAWNLNLVKLIEAARSYVELELVIRMQNSLIKNSVDKECKNTFKTISDIFALNVINQNLSFYLVNQYLDVDQAKKIMDGALPDLYQKLNPIIGEIVNSFNVPDFLLRAPIGLSNGQCYINSTLQSIGFKPTH